MRFRHILVPLDGSRLAEDALPAAAALAGALGARITLLHVVERDAPHYVHGDRHITSPTQGAAYLAAVADDLRARAIEVDTHVHQRGVEDVAVAIDLHAHEYAVDLIAMCKHGQSGVRRMMVGSIAQQILRGGSTPILLRSAGEATERSFDCRNVLVSLDPRHDADTTLAVAGELAGAFGAAVHLMTVLPSLAQLRRSSVPARLLPSATAEELRMEREHVGRQLGDHADHLSSGGLVVRVALVEDDPATAILEAAERIPADLVVLPTHARVGFDAWYTGRTGQRVITGTRRTLLLLREP